VSISSSPEIPLKRRDYWILCGLALVVNLAIAALQPVPGYMDADYYFAGGKQLAAGNGFQELFLWNFLDQPQGLPHPSHAYWYPLASIVAAGGMALTDNINFVNARLGFVIMAVLAPLVVMSLAVRITKRRSLALLSGILTVFSGYYLPFIVTTDNYSLYLLFGACYFILLDRLTVQKAGLLGLLAGIFNLARSDGLLWLPLTIVAVTALSFRQSPTTPLRNRILKSIGYSSLSLFGYLMVMGAWFLRNLSVFGSLLPPGSGYLLWMTNYNQIYSYTPQIYTLQSWLANGFQQALSVRLEALLQNISTAIFAQGMLVLFPLVVVGAYSCRNMVRIQVGVLGWILLLLIESLLFPFASVRGGFFHAGTAFQPLWFVLAPLGIEVLAVRFIKNKKFLSRTINIFRLSLAVFVIVLSAMLVKIRVIDSGWNEGEYLYRKTDQFLVEQGARPEEIVMTRNPPAYFIMTGRQAIVVPYGNLQTVLEVVQKFQVSYLILEPGSASGDLLILYDYPMDNPNFNYLGRIDETIILSFKR
jgi:hypothetical protein